MARLEKPYTEYYITKKKYLKDYKNNLSDKYSLTAETNNFSFSLIGTFDHHSGKIISYDYDIYSGDWGYVIEYDEYDEGVICDRYHDKILNYWNDENNQDYITSMGFKYSFSYNEKHRQRFRKKFNIDRDNARKLYNNIESVNINGTLAILPNFHPHLINFVGEEKKSGFEIEMPNEPIVVYESAGRGKYNKFKDGMIFSPSDYICAYWDNKKKNTLVYDMRLNEETIISGANPKFIQNGELLLTSRVIYNIITGEISELNQIAGLSKGEYKYSFYGDDYLINDGLSLIVRTKKNNKSSDLIIYNNKDKIYIYDSRKITYETGVDDWFGYSLSPLTFLIKDGKYHILFHNKIKNRKEINNQLFLWNIDLKTKVWEINQSDLDGEYTNFNVITDDVVGIITTNTTINMIDLSSGSIIKSINPELKTDGYFHNITSDNKLLIKHGYGGYTAECCSWSWKKETIKFPYKTDEFHLYDLNQMDKEDTYKINGLKLATTKIDPTQFAFSYDRRFVASRNPFATRIDYSTSHSGFRRNYGDGLMIQYVKHINN